jgi:hypothetical protein
VVVARLLVGCEDGPAQSYTPAAGTLFNNGAVDGSVNPGDYPIDGGYAGISRTAVCTADLKRARWAKMLTEDIVPPRLYAGLDMAGGGEWAGLKVEQAELAPDPMSMTGANCQGTALPNANCPSGNGACGQVYWGDNQEVTFIYNLATHVVDQMSLTLGYTGKMTFHDRSKAHTYVLQIGLPPTKDGQTFLIPWDNANCTGDANNPCYDEAITELFNAAMNTFAVGAGLPWPTDTKSCLKDRNCLQYPNDGSGNTIFGFRPLVVYFLGNQHAGLPQPVASTPTQLYNFYTKLEPYSKAPETLKLDKDGPSATLKVGDQGKTCTVAIGQTYQSFLDNCINVWADQSLNTLDTNKLLGGRSHNYENIFFNVVGVNQNFSLTPELSTYQVVQDGDEPHPNDVATDWYFDVRASANVANEAGVLIGTGLVEREYARLVQLDINTSYVPGAHRHAIGDAKCQHAPYDVGCTGFESMIMAGGVCDANGNCTPYPDDPPGMLVDGSSYNSSVLSPGDPVSVFIDNIGQVAKGPFWDNSLQQVVRVLGHGDILALPPALRDRRYFFRWFGIAEIKYLKAYASCGMTCTPTQVADQPIDMEGLFFDNNYLNQFDKFEYIDRSLVENPPPADRPYLGVPLDYEYGTDVKAGNQRYTNYYRRLDREENAMFTAMATNKSDMPGQENDVNITNLYGSMVLRAAYPSYYCATAAFRAGQPVDAAGWKSHGCSKPPPLDANGDTLLDLNGQMAAFDSAHAGAYPNAKPLLSYYPGVWGKTIFSQGHSPIRVTQGDLLIEGAHVVVPSFFDPYNTCPQKGLDPAGNPCDPGDTKYAKPIEVLVPWLPNQPGNGFYIPFDGTTAKQIQSAELAFEGVLETYHIYYEPWNDVAKRDCSSDGVCNTGFACQAGQCVAADQTIRIAAIDASDFLGEVFLCQDPLTHDLLRVRMYTSTLDVLDWLARHPGDAAAGFASAQDACNIIVRYSPYDNYPDYISSVANGVTVNTNQGQGFGRIVDATLFDINYENQ